MNSWELLSLKRPMIFRAPPSCCFVSRFCAALEAARDPCVGRDSVIKTELSGPSRNYTGFLLLYLITKNYCRTGTVRTFVTM